MFSPLKESCIFIFCDAPLILVTTRENAGVSCPRSVMMRQLRDAELRREKGRTCDVKLSLTLRFRSCNAFDGGGWERVKLVEVKQYFKS